MSHSEFDIRMKSYENINKTFLLKKTPIIIRIDGRAFHTFTRGMVKPFDEILSSSMTATAEHLVNNVSNCIFAYTQSDEISLLLADYQTDDTSPWFDNNQQKLVSISASIATLVFNREFADYVTKYTAALSNIECSFDERQELEKYRLAYVRARLTGAMFDARAFNLPKEEIVNYFIWRQQDATRNSIQMVAQSEFSHNKLQGKNTSELQDLLMNERGINWNNTPVKFKRGVAIYKKPEEIVTQKDGKDITVIRMKSYVDYDIPVFTKDRDFIKKFSPYLY